MTTDTATILGFVSLVLLKIFQNLPSQTGPLLKNDAVDELSTAFIIIFVCLLIILSCYKHQTHTNNSWYTAITSASLADTYAAPPRIGIALLRIVGRWCTSIGCPADRGIWRSPVLHRAASRHPGLLSCSIGTVQQEYDFSSCYLLCCRLAGQISSPFCNTSLAAFLFLSNAWV